ncbi:hypothetical protein H5410_044909, partial [Solanum commersonii]
CWAETGTSPVYHLTNSSSSELDSGTELNMAMETNLENQAPLKLRQWDICFCIAESLTSYGRLSLISRGIQWTMPSTTVDTLSSWEEAGKGAKNRSYWRTIPACIWWTIWKDRNASGGYTNTIVLYGAECWPVKNAHVQKMKVVDMRMLRWMSKHTRKYMIKNEVIRDKVGVAFMAKR